MPTVIHWEIWTTAGDTRVCTNCALLHGVIFKYEEGPRPPLHQHCRCFRNYHHTEVIPDPVPPVQPPASGPLQPPAPIPMPAPNPPPAPLKLPWWWPLPFIPLLLPKPGISDEDPTQ